MIGKKKEIIFVELSLQADTSSDLSVLLITSHTRPDIMTQLVYLTHG
jgi:hypothetical protein